MNSLETQWITYNPKIHKGIIKGRTNWPNELSNPCPQHADVFLLGEVSNTNQVLFVFQSMCLLAADSDHFQIEQTPDDLLSNSKIGSVLLG